MTDRAVEVFQPREVIKLGDYPKTKFNLLIPGEMGVQVSPFLRPVVRQVSIDPDPDAGEVYPVEWMQRNGRPVPRSLGIGAVGIAKLASVAGSIDVPQASGRVDDGRDRDVATYRATMAMRLPDGEWRVVTRECTVKLQTLAKEIRAQKEKKGRENTDRQGKSAPWPKERIEEEIRKELLLKEKFLERLAETGAKNRCVRALLALKTKYSPEELARPFVLAAVVPDVNQPELRERLLDQATSATSAIFGPQAGQVSSAPRQLAAGPTAADVAQADDAQAAAELELQPEEVGAVAGDHRPLDEDRTVETATGEIHADEPDWFASKSSPPAAAAVDVVVELRKRTKARKTGPATEVQRQQLKDALRGLSTPDVAILLDRTWQFGNPAAINEGQADAVLALGDEWGDEILRAHWQRHADRLHEEEAAA